MNAYIDKQKCSADNRICKPLTECPNKAISWIEDDDEPLGSRIEIDEKKCVGYGTCVPLCCGDAIEVR